MRTWINRVQDQAPTAKAREKALDRPRKARNRDLYYGTFHIECYWFVQQCENHFATARANGYKCMRFVAFFLTEQVLAHWQQHKFWTECNSVISIIWDKFKVFLRKSLGKSTSFMDTICSKIKKRISILANKKYKTRQPISNISNQF